MEGICSNLILMNCKSENIHNSSRDHLNQYSHPAISSKIEDVVSLGICEMNYVYGIEECIRKRSKLLVKILSVYIGG